MGHTLHVRIGELGIVFVRLFSIFILIIIPASATVTNIVSSGDTYVYANDIPKGSSIDIYVGNDSAGRSYGLVVFDISSIPASSIINSATLYLYQEPDTGDATGYISSIYNITSSWSESTVGVSTLPTFNPTPFTTALGLASQGWVTWTVTNTVNAWYTGSLANNGFLLNETSGNPNFIIYFSKEYSSNKPYLSVDYSIIPVMRINTIYPTTAYVSDTLTSTPYATDADGDSVSYSYQWYKNGSVLSGQTAGTLSSPLTAGASYKVLVTPSDSYGSGTGTYSNIVTVEGSYPTYSDYDTVVHGDNYTGATNFVYRLNVTNMSGTSNRTHLYLGGTCAQVNCTDYILLDNNQTEEPHWIESNATSTEWGVWWVNYIRTGSRKQWYGNKTNATRNNTLEATKTFTQFHGAETTSYADNSLGAYNPLNIVYQSKTSETTGNSARIGFSSSGFSYTTAGDWFGVQIACGQGLYPQTQKGGTNYGEITGTSYPACGQAYLYRVEYNGTYVKYYLDSDYSTKTLIGTIGANLPVEPSGLYGVAYAPATYSQDYSFAYPYIASEPTKVLWGSPQDSNHIPIVQNVTISPSSPGGSSNLTISLNATDEDGDTLINHLIWYKNNVLQTTWNDSTYVNYTANFTQGDSIFVRGFVYDGRVNSSEVQSNIVNIGSGNAAPILSGITLNPNTQKYNKNISINATTNITDAESTLVRLLTYYYNGSNKIFLANSSWVTPQNYTNISVIIPFSDGLSHSIYGMAEDNGNVTQDPTTNLTGNEVTATFTSDITAPTHTTSSLSAASITVGGTVTITAQFNGQGANISSATVNVERPDATIANWTMTCDSGEIVTCTYLYTSTSDVGTYDVRYFYPTDYSGNTGTITGTLSFSASAAVVSSGGGGGGGGSTVTIIEKETVKENATSVIPLLRVKNLTTTQPGLEEISKCLTESLFLANKCSGFNYGVVVEPTSWFLVFSGAFLMAGAIVVGRGIYQDKPREWVTEPLLYGTTTVLVVVVLVSSGINLYLFNLLFNSPLYAYSFFSVALWSGIVSLVWDEYYYGKKTYKILRKP